MLETENETCDNKIASKACHEFETYSWYVGIRFSVNKIRFSNLHVPILFEDSVLIAWLFCAKRLKKIVFMANLKLLERMWPCFISRPSLQPAHELLQSGKRNSKEHFSQDNRCSEEKAKMSPSLTAPLSSYLAKPWLYTVLPMLWPTEHSIQNKRQRKRARNMLGVTKC